MRSSPKKKGLTLQEREELWKFLNQAGESRDQTRRVMVQCSRQGMTVEKVRAELNGLRRKGWHSYHRENLEALDMWMSMYTTLISLPETCDEDDEGNEDEGGVGYQENPVKKEPASASTTAAGVAMVPPRAGPSSPSVITISGSSDDEENTRGDQEGSLIDREDPAEEQEDPAEEREDPAKEREVPQTNQEGPPVDSAQVWKCNLCSFKSNLIGMTTHQRKTHQRRDVTCHHCPFIAKKSAELWKHTRDIHPGTRDQTVRCKQCKRAFPTKGALHQHWSSRSNPCRPPEQSRTPRKCASCQRTFRTETAWITHTNKGKCTPRRRPLANQEKGTGIQGPAKRKVGKETYQRRTDQRKKQSGLINESSLGALKSKIAQGYRKVGPKDDPIVKAIEVVYMSPTDPRNKIRPLDCFVAEQAPHTVERGKEDVLVLYTREEEKYEAILLLIRNAISRIEAKNEILLHPPRVKNRYRASTCKGQCPHPGKVLVQTGTSAYLQCVRQDRSTRCSNAKVLERGNRTISRIPGEPLPTEPAALATYTEYFQVVDDTSKVCGEYVESLVTDRYAIHVAHSEGSKCRTGPGNKNRPFSTVNHLKQRGSHVHFDENCETGTLTVVADFGTITGSGRQRQSHILCDFRPFKSTKTSPGLEIRTHPGDIIIEDAKMLRHASTSPQEGDDLRMALVFYKSTNLDAPDHGVRVPHKDRNLENPETANKESVPVEVGDEDGLEDNEEEPPQDSRSATAPDEQGAHELPSGKKRKEKKKEKKKKTIPTPVEIAETSQRREEENTSEAARTNKKEGKKARNGEEAARDGPQGEAAPKRKRKMESRAEKKAERRKYLEKLASDLSPDDESSSASESTQESTSEEEVDQMIVALMKKIKKAQTRRREKKARKSQKETLNPGSSSSETRSRSNDPEVKKARTTRKMAKKSKTKTLDQGFISSESGSDDPIDN